MMEDFLFVDLAGMTMGKPFAGFAAGSFVDMFGREVEFKAAQLKTFVANTKKAIAAALSKGMPGLPIDARQHDKGDAAGWIVDASEGAVTDSDGQAVPVVMLTAEWTVLGQELIRERIQANFSPTVDLRAKVIRGGSLTNWPASVDANGVPLFPAVELAEGIYRIELEQSQNQENEMTREEIAALVAEAVAEALAAQKQADTDGEQAEADAAGDTVAEEMAVEFKAQLADQFELMKKKAVAEAAEMVAQMRREADVAEFAAMVTGGTPDVPYGLPVDAAELRGFLSRLQPADLEFAKKLLGDIQANGRQSFGEVGHGKRTRVRAALPREYATLLGQHIAAGGAIEQWFEYAGIGDMADYDLSAFNEEK